MFDNSQDNSGTTETQPLSLEQARLELAAAKIELDKSKTYHNALVLQWRQREFDELINKARKATKLLNCEAGKEIYYV